jgi:serine/threonine-protein kinase
MAKKPEERYQSAAEFATALRALAAGSDMVATSAAPNEAASEATVISMPGVPEAPLAPTVRMERPPFAATAAVPATGPAPIRPEANESPPVPASSARKPLNPFILAGIAAGVAALGLGAYLYLGPPAKEARMADAVPVAPPQEVLAQNARVPTVTIPAATPSAPPSDAPGSVPLDVPSAPGTMIISALGLADPKDPRFNGDAAAAQAEARADARRALIDKALAVYVQPASLDQHYALVRDRLLADPAAFIDTVISEGAPRLGKDGLVSTEARAAVRMRALQTSLNKMTKEERNEFIR